MTYIEGFIAAVPIANKDAYVDHATGLAPLIRELGATRMVESWSDDVPEGKVTDFRKSVQAKDDEAVVFSWFEYPDRAARDAADEKMMSDPRMKEIGAGMPFDGKRLLRGFPVPRARADRPGGWGDALDRGGIGAGCASE